MKLKSLLFGSAAVIAAGTGAQAADLPIAEPVEYVRICDTFGPGYYYIPGTDTCLRVGGRVFYESNYVDGDNFVTPLAEAESSTGFLFPGLTGTGSSAPTGTVTAGNANPIVISPFFPNAYTDEEREFNNWTSRVRANIRLDARTQTDFGLIKTFINAEANRGNANYGVNGAGGDFSIANAYIQIANDWGTYTAGRAGSYFNFMGGLPFNSRGVGIDASDDDKNLWAWTLAGGNGFSATISIEDPLEGHNRQNSTVSFATFGGPVADGVLFGGVPLSTVPFGSSPGFDNYEGQELPDLVGNLRIDQGWGSAMIMGAVRHLHDEEFFESGFPTTVLGLADEDGFPAADEDSDGDGIGYAVGLGLGLNIPFGGLRFDTQVGYSEGAIRYVTGDPIQNGFFGGITTGDFLGPDADGDSLTEAFSLRAMLGGDLTQTISWNVGGSYTEIDSAETTLLLGPGLDITFEGIDYNHFSVGGALLYSPVEGLTFGWEGAYAELQIENSDAQRIALSNFTTDEDTFEMFRSTFRVNSEF